MSKEKYTKYTPQFQKESKYQKNSWTTKQDKFMTEI